MLSVVLFDVEVILCYVEFEYWDVVKCVVECVECVWDWWMVEMIEFFDLGVLYLVENVVCVVCGDEVEVWVWGGFAFAEWWRVMIVCVDSVDEEEICDIVCVLRV